MNSHANWLSSSEADFSAHARTDAAGLGFEIDNLVKRSGEVNKRTPCTDAVENRRNGEFIGFHNGRRPTDRSWRPRRMGCIVAIAPANRSQPMAITQLLIPEPRARKHDLSTVDDLYRREQTRVQVRGWFPSTAHAGFAAGHFGVVYGCNAALRSDFAQHGIQIEPTGSHAEVEKFRYAKDVEMPVERRHLASWNQQDTIEVGLQLAHRIILRIGVVVGDGDEVQPARRCRLGGQKDRTRHHSATLTGAVAITVAGVHMQIATIPASASHQRTVRKAHVLVARVEADLGPVMRDGFRPHIRYRDQQTPLARRNGAWQIGRSRIGFADGEMALVATTLSTKSLRVKHAKVKRRVCLFTGVLKIHTDAMGASRHAKRNLNVGLVLRSCDFTGEHVVGWRILRPSLLREDE